MLTIQRTLVLLAAAGAVIAPMVLHTPDGQLASTTTIDPRQLYSDTQVEHYLTAEQVAWIRPGLVVEVESVEVTADRYPVVVLSFSDDLGQPLDRDGVITPGSVNLSFILAWYDAANRDYVAYTTRPQTSPITGDTENQASTDSGGSIEDSEMGRIRYTFGTQLPADFDRSRTHTLGIYASRNLTEQLGKTYYDNVEHDFRPDGAAVTDVWAAIDDATCNSCHEQLALHGGSRRDVKLCALCHNSTTIDPDTGNTVDLKVMIHKIHMGALLPSVEAGMPYQIIGYRQSVHDYSEVVLPRDIRNCATCHKADAPEGDIWFTRPSRATCGSCHDNIVWDTGEGHPLPQLDDSACASCHQPVGDREFDASIMGAHVVPTRSAQLAGLNMEILDVTGAVPGGLPTVTFRVTNDDGSFVDPASLNRLSILVGGPTSDYAEYMTQTATGATVSGDVAMYTFGDPLPADAAGTWGFTADVYRFVTIDDGSDEGLEVREAAFNQLFYVPVTDTAAVPRRQVVSLDKCNVCHDTLALHGGQRFNVEECVICHNPNENDSVVRPAEEMPPESIHLKWMIHRIHTGIELANDFTVYGYRGSVHNYNHVGYPGDLRTCEGCHLPGTYSVPLPEDTLATQAERDYFTPIPPASAACLSCHSTLDAAAHAFVNIAPFGEACAACHGEDRDHAVALVHAH